MYITTTILIVKVQFTKLLDGVAVEQDEMFTFAEISSQQTETDTNPISNKSFLEPRIVIENKDSLCRFVNVGKTKFFNCTDLPMFTFLRLQQIFLSHQKQ